MVNEQEVLGAAQENLNRIKKLLKQLGKELDDARAFKKNKETFLAAAQEGVRKQRGNLSTLRSGSFIVSLAEWKVICVEVQRSEQFVTNLQEQVRLSKEQVKFFEEMIEDTKRNVAEAKREFKALKKLAKGATVLKFPESRRK